MWLDFILVFIGTIVLRGGCRLASHPGIWRDPFPAHADEGDVMTHLVLVDMTRRNGHRIPCETPQFLLSSEFDYPALYHKLLSYLPRSALERGEWLVSPVIEGIHAMFVYVAAGWLLMQTGVYEVFPRHTAMAITVAWACTPVLTWNPRRGSYLGERPFGHLFGHAFLFLLVVYSFTQEPWVAIGIVGCSAIVTSSSKFAFQAIVFIGLVFAFLMGYWWSGVLVLGSVALSCILTGGYTLRVLRGIVRHSRFYATFLMHVHDYTRNIHAEDLVVGIQQLLSGRLRTARSAFARHPLYRIVVLTPWLCGVALWTFFGESGTPAADAMFGWVAAAVLVAIATATDWLKFLGESERYLEFALLPLVILTVLVPPPFNPSLFVGVLAWCLYRVFRGYWQSYTSTAVPTEMSSLFAWLAAQSHMTLIEIPGRLSFPIAYHTSHRSVWWFINAPREPLLSQWKELFDGGTTYPYMAPSALRSAHRRHGAHAIVVDVQGERAVRGIWGLEYRLEDHPVLYEDGRYRVYDAIPRDEGQ